MKANAVLSKPSVSPVIALAVVLVAAFMDLLDSTIVSVAAPAISRSLNASDAALQWMIAGYTLALGVGLITGGRIGDLFGRRRTFLTGLAGFTIASALCALAPTAEALVAARIVQGLAGALMIPQVFGIIRSSFTSDQRAKAFGVYGGVLGLASVAGPLLGGFLVDTNLFNMGWRAVFWVNVPIGIIGFIYGLRNLSESREEGAARLDLIGAALVALSTLFILLPLVQSGEGGWSWWSVGLMLLAVPMMALFLIREQRLVAKGEQPIFDPALLRVRAFSSGLAAALLFFGAIGSFFLLLSLYLVLGTGRSALDTGLVILPYAIGSIITSGIGVQLANRAGRKLLVSASLLLALSQLLLLFVTQGGVNPSFWALALPLFIGGLGIGLASPILINVVLAGVPGRSAGVAGGVLTTTTQIGNAIGVAVLGILFFSILESALASGVEPLVAYSDAFVSILPWQIACYVIAAGLMLLLPARANAQEE